MQHRNLVFLDTETTGNDPSKDRLVQLAVCEIAPLGDLNQPIEVFYYKPPCEISIGAMATHHITNAEASHYAPFDDKAREYFNARLRDSIVIAHNAPFDVGIMKNEGVEIPGYIDTLKVAKRIFDLESYSLQFLRYSFGIFDNYIPSSTGVAVPPHDARADVFILQKVFAKMIGAIPTSAGEVDPIEWMLDVTSKPLLLRKVSFGKHKGQTFAEVPRSYLEWLDKQTDIDADLRHTIDHHLGRLPLV